MFIYVIHLSTQTFIYTLQLTKLQYFHIHVNVLQSGRTVTMVTTSQSTGQIFYHGFREDSILFWESPLID